MINIITSPLLKNFPEIKHGFFTKEGGVSTGLYKSLNFGFGSDDDEKNISENYQLASVFLEILKKIL